MPELKLDKVAARHRRHLRIRQKLVGTPERPRLCVFRSLKHIYAQVVDDTTGRVLISASSLSTEAKQSGVSGGNVPSARIVGQLVAEKAKAAGLQQVIFDRGGYLYHGRVKALAEGAREKGLKF
jgi:large subunit ribosomal protein L18